MEMRVLLLVLLVLAEAETAKKDKLPKPTKEELQLANAINHFTIDLYNVIRKGAASENIFMGPISITTAMTMVLLGSQGKGADELKELLYIKDGTLGIQWGVNQVHETYQHMNSRLYGEEPGMYTFQGANKLYPDTKLEIVPSYIKNMITFYETTIERLDFGNTALATKTINDWIANKTNDMLKDVLQDGDITSETIFVLVNAIYFKGQWINKFDPEKTNKTGEFHVARDISAQVEMMYNESSFNFYNLEKLDAKLLELQYLGNKFSMIIILPNKRFGLSELEKNLKYAHIKEAIDGINDKKDGNGGPRRVKVWLPKLKYRKRYDMLTVLQKMGMKSALDMSGISPDPRMSITSIIHEAAIEVNEEGTEAAAVTVIIAGRSAGPQPIDFRCDHPFLFFIQDRISGAILFFGRVTDPSGTVAPTGRSSGTPPKNDFDCEANLKEIQKIIPDKCSCKNNELKCTLKDAGQMKLGKP